MQALLVARHFMFIGEILMEGLTMKGTSDARSQVKVKLILK